MAGYRALVMVLGAQERARHIRFRHRALQERYVLAHAAVRLLVARRCAIDPCELHFFYDALGALRLAGQPGLAFSISYSAGYALVAVIEERRSGRKAAPIGVDLEALRGLGGDAQGLIGLYCTPQERIRLYQMLEEEEEDADKDHAFLALWVRKEACLKALGSGLSRAPSSFDCGVGSGWRRSLVGGYPVESDVWLDPRCALLIAWARCCED